MKKLSYMFLVLSAISLVVLGCAQTTDTATTTTAAAATTTTAATATTTTSSTTTTAAGMITGQILVPASSITGLSIQASAIRAFATAEDGVSNTPLAGASVLLCDPVTGLQITGTSTLTADSNGNFSTSESIIGPDNWLPSDGYILFKATKDSTTDTDKVIVQTIASTNAAGGININAGSSLTAAKLAEEMAKKAGDLFSKASSLDATQTAQLKSLMISMYSQISGSIGTIASSNIPTLVFNASGKTDTELHKSWFEGLSGSAGSEFTAPSGWDNTLNSYYNYATNLVTGANYPTGMVMPVGYSGFVIPSGMSLPPNAVFSYSPMGASFLPSGMTLPTGASFLSGFTLPSYYSNAIPSGAYMGSGADIPSGTVLPSGLSMGAGFLIPSGVNFGSGLTIPSGVNMGVGLIIPSGVNLGSGYVVPSGVSFGAGYEIPSGVSFGSGFVIPSGLDFQSGYVMPSGVSWGSGFNPPSDIQYQSGWTQPSGWTPPSGFVPPSGQSGFSGFQSGQQSGQPPSGGQPSGGPSGGPSGFPSGGPPSGG